MGLSNWLKRALKRFFKASKKSPELTVRRLADSYSCLTRFIFENRKFSKNPPKAKQGAFLPDATLKTSISGSDGLSEGEIWLIGKKVGVPRGKQPSARADFNSAAVSEAKLKIENDPQPDNERHLNLIGWPIEKDERKAIALLLCMRSTLVTPPSTGRQDLGV